MLYRIHEFSYNEVLSFARSTNESIGLLPIANDISACHDLSFTLLIRLVTNTINISSLLDMEQIIQENDLNEMFFFFFFTQFIVKQNYCYTFFSNSNSNADTLSTTSLSLPFFLSLSITSHLQSKCIVEKKERTNSNNRRKQKKGFGFDSKLS